jgi:hypothetical protein
MVCFMHASSVSRRAAAHDTRSGETLHGVPHRAGHGEDAFDQDYAHGGGEVADRVAQLRDR